MVDKVLKVKRLKPGYWSIIDYLDQPMIILKYGSLEYNVYSNKYDLVTCDGVYLGRWRYGELTKKNILKYVGKIDWQLKIRVEDIKESEVLFLM
jgi:hypothetical protein